MIYPYHSTANPIQTPGKVLPMDREMTRFWELRRERKQQEKRK